MEELKNKLLGYLPNLGSALIIFVIGLLIAFLMGRGVRKGLQLRKVDPSLTSFICKSVRLLIFIFALIAALSALGISVTGLIAFFSAAAAAVALALKDRLSDIASGIVILFTKPFVTGDFIAFNNYQGFVQKIDIIHTDILTYDGTNVIIPNSVISNAEVNNFTAHPQVRVTVEVPIPYDADIKTVKDILLGVVADTDLILRDDERTPKIRLERFGDSAMEFTIRCFCEYKDYWTVYYALTENTKEALDKNGITIPFNQLDVHLDK